MMLRKLITGLVYRCSSACGLAQRCSLACKSQRVAAVSSRIQNSFVRGQGTREPSCPCPLHRRCHRRHRVGVFKIIKISPSHWPSYNSHSHNVGPVPLSVRITHETIPIELLLGLETLRTKIHCIKYTVIDTRMLWTKKKQKISTAYV